MKGMEMQTRELIIEGMNCGHCVMAVKKELSKLRDIIVEDVQIGKARVQFDDSKVSREALEKAINDAGYRLVSVA
jgi:copper chaperone